MRQAIFTDSTPAPLLDGTIPTPWRVAHADRMRDLLNGLGYSDAVAYVEYDGKTAGGAKRLWIGLRDNRDGAAHEAGLRALGAVLRSLGFTTEPVNRSGRQVALRVVDAGSFQEVAQTMTINLESPEIKRDIMAWVIGRNMNEWNVRRIFKAFGSSDAAEDYLSSNGLGWGGLWDEVKRREQEAR